MLKKEFNEYLSSIGLTDILIERVSHIYAIYRNMIEEMGEEIDDLFISEYINSDGTRVYEKLYFFSKKYFMITENFTLEDNFRISSQFKLLNNVQIYNEDYDFKKANDKSRLYVKYIKSFGFKNELKASKENCDFLNGIIKRHLLSNLK